MHIRWHNTYCHSEALFLVRDSAELEPASAGTQGEAQGQLALVHQYEAPQRWKGRLDPPRQPQQRNQLGHMIWQESHHARIRTSPRAVRKARSSHGRDHAAREENRAAPESPNSGQSGEGHPGSGQKQQRQAGLVSLFKLRGA